MQTQFDLRTGRETGIVGNAVNDRVRAACSTLNRQRTRGLTEAARQAPSRESLSADVWAAAIARNASNWHVPLVSLNSLGLSRDRDGFISAAGHLQPLKSGAEASPFADKEWGVVYKLFPLFINGGLGKTFEIERDEQEGRFQMSVRDAVLLETIKKLTVLHEAGAHPTELVGLEQNGDYLIAKQPLATPYLDLDEDRKVAISLMRAIPCRARFGRAVWIVWEDEQAWVMSDLHPGNIMRDANGQPCIIDSLLAPLPPRWTIGDRDLCKDVEDAKAFRFTGRMPTRREFGDDVSDEEL